MFALLFRGEVMLFSTSFYIAVGWCILVSMFGWRKYLLFRDRYKERKRDLETILEKLINLKSKAVNKISPMSSNDRVLISSKEMWNELQVCFNGTILEQIWKNIYASREEIKRGQDNHYDDKYTKVYVLTPIEDFFDADRFIYEDITDKFTEQMPSLLTGSGILGTFIGLTFSLSNISTGDSESLQQSINQLINGSGMSFFTSIVGIGASLGVSWKLSKKKDNISSDYIEIKNIVSDLIETRSTNQLIAEQSNMLYQQKSDIQEAVSKISIGIVNGITGVFNNDLGPILQGISTSLEQTNAYLKDTSEKLNILAGGSLEGMDKLFKEFAGSEIKRLGESIDKMSEFFDKFSDLQSGLETLVKGLTESAQGIRESMINGGQQISGNVERVSTLLDGSVERLSGTLDGIITRIEAIPTQLKDIESFMDSFRLIVDGLHTSTQTIENTSTYLKDSLQGVEDKREVFLASANELLQQVQELRASEADNTTVIVKSVSTMKENWEAYNSQYKTLIENLGGLVSSIQETANTYHEEMKNEVALMLDSISKASADYAENLDTSLDKTGDMIRDYQETMKRGIDEMKDGVESLENSVSSILGEIDKTTASIGEHFSGVVSEMQDTSDSFIEKMKEIQGTNEGNRS